MDGLALPCPAIELVPHRPPMCLLDSLDVFTEEAGEASCTIAADHPFQGQNDALDQVVLIELLAQAAAAHEGFNRLRGGGAVGGGFLAGVRSFHFHDCAMIGDTARILAARDIMLGSLQKIRGRVECERGLLAEGELMFYLSEEQVPEIMSSSGEEPDAPAAVPASDLRQIPAALEAARTSLDAKARCALFRFDSSFPAFNGHFPGQPILPAVVTVLAAKQLLAALEDREILLRTIKSAKFTRPLFPGAEVELRCEPVTSEAPAARRVVAVAEDAVVSRMSLLVDSEGATACG